MKNFLSSHEIWLDRIRKNKLLILLLAGLIFRLLLTPFAVHGDILSQAQWGRWMDLHGFAGLYDEEVWSVEWPNHTPLISIWYGLSYPLHRIISERFLDVGTFIAFNHLGASKLPFFYNFLLWFGSDNYKLTGVMNGIIITLKFLPILGDLGLSLIVYYFAKANSKKALFYTSLFLFLPFSWYLSALWGQTDQIATLLLTLSFILLYKREFILSPIILTVAFDLKPTVLLFIPIYLIWLIIKRANLIYFTFGSLLAFIFVYYTASFFTHNYAWSYTDVLMRKIFFTKPPVTTVSAFNLWFILHGNDRLSDTHSVLLSFRNWGLLGYLGVNFLALKAALKKNWQGLFSSLFIIGFGAWLVLTNMYERYVFAGIFYGLMLAIFQPKILKYWIVLSFIYLIDMYHGWWFPDWFPFLENQIYDNDWLLARLLSLCNIIIFGIICYKVLDFPKAKLAKFMLHFKPNFGKIP